MDGSCPRKPMSGEPATAATNLSSSVMTPVFKLGVPPVLLGVGMIGTYEDLQRADLGIEVIALALMWGILLWMGYACVRLKKVIAYPDHLLIGNYLTHSSVPYGDIEEIKGYRWQNVVLVRLRVRHACRFGRTIHFVLPSHFGRIRLQPEFQLLQERSPHLCVVKRRWWLGALYLRPRSDDSVGSSDSAGEHTAARPSG